MEAEQIPHRFSATLARLTLLVLDVDGVLTDGSIILDERGVEYKCFHSRDGYGIKALLAEGLTVAVISGRTSRAVEIRMASLGVSRLLQGCSDKKAGLEQLLAELSMDVRHTACMGDDTIDLPMFELAAFRAAVRDAHPEVVQQADWVSTCNGGRGAVRELCDLILAARRTQRRPAG